MDNEIPGVTKAVPRGRPSLKEKQLELRETMILDAASELLMSKGFSFVTLEDVIAEVGISKPTFYQHFRSKEELFASAMVRGMGESIDFLKDLRQTSCPDVALVKMIEWAFNKRFGSENACFYDLPGVLSLLTNEGVRAAHAELIAEMAAIVEWSQREGTAKKGIPPILIAQVVMSVFQDWGYNEMFISGCLTLDGLKEGIIKLILVGDLPPDHCE